MTKRPGQIALIVILVVVVGLTVAVSVLSRSVTTVSISTKEQEKARSFSAAEAGIEDALRQDLSFITAGGSFRGDFTIGPGGESNVDYSVSKVSVIQAKISPGRTITIDWTVPGVTATIANVKWNNSACATLVAKEITSTGTITNILATDGAIGHDFLNDPISAKIVRFRIVGCATDTNIIITGTGGNLSFYQVDSTGTSSDSTSKVQVIRSEPAPIGLLDYAIFSGGNIN